jgi:hypothetical protein
MPVTEDDDDMMMMMRPARSSSSPATRPTTSSSITRSVPMSGHGFSWGVMIGGEDYGGDGG